MVQAVPPLSGIETAVATPLRSVLSPVTRGVVVLRLSADTCLLCSSEKVLIASRGSRFLPASATRRHGQCLVLSLVACRLLLQWLPPGMLLSGVNIGKHRRFVGTDHACLDRMSRLLPFCGSCVHDEPSAGRTVQWM